jgi:hypothetical protein
MKTSLFTLLILSFFLASAPLTHAQPAEKTLVKAFNLKGHDVVLMDVKGDVQVIKWTQDQLRVQMTVRLEHGTVTILKSLVTTGRYNIESDESDGDFTIRVPGLAKQIKLNSGYDLGETISYIVYAPEKVFVKVKEETGEGFGDDTKASSF